MILHNNKNNKKTVDSQWNPGYSYVGLTIPRVEFYVTAQKQKKKIINMK